MNKKILAIVGIAVVIAAGAGAFAISRGTDIQRDKNYDNIASVGVDTEAADLADDPQDDVQDADDQARTDTAAEETIQDDATAVEDQAQGGPDYSEDIVAQEYHVMRTVDHTTGDEYQPRVVMGREYTYCYVKFDSSGKFEIMLDPSSGEVRKGTFTLYDDIISVQYEDGAGSEYSIIAGSDTPIDYIIVNYGDYDVYFG